MHEAQTYTLLKNALTFYLQCCELDTSILITRHRNLFWEGVFCLQPIKAIRIPSILYNRQLFADQY
jgi:hypothetical protein